MGRKHLIQEEDPILQKNHRIEKRRKTKLQERARQQQEREKQKQRLEQLSRIKQLVLDEQKNMVKQALSKQPSSMCFLKQVGVRSPTHLRPTPTIKATLPSLNLLESPLQPTAQYSQHFSPLDQDLIVRVQKQIVPDTSTQVKNDLRELFGKEPIKEEIIEREEDEYDYELKKELKQIRNVTVNGAEFLVSRGFEREVGRMGLAGGLGRSAVQGYRDYVHVENKEEATIADFRAIYTEHIISHLKLCGEQQQSRGFTNAKILILTPFMGDARSIIDLIVDKIGLPEVNRQRVDAMDDETDLFRISITISQRNKRIKYFANFDHAHIIIASPLGLRTITGSQGEQNRDFSFLSSIQILIIQRAHVILMQNWSHLLQVIGCLNKMPKYQSMVNPIQSIREGFLSNKSKFYRQNIVFSEFSFPELNALAKRHFDNKDGIISDVHYYAGLQFTNNQFHQEFIKIELPSFEKDLEVRLDFFRRKLWNKILGDELLQHYVIFAGSYFQFLKIKSFFEKINAPAVYISEHTKKPKVQSRLSRFNNKQFRFLVTTERAYYFEVCKIQKIQNILFYSLPKNSWIYRQLIQSLRHPKTHQIGPTQMNSVISLCSKYDIHALQRIIGTIQAQELLSENNRSGSLII